MNRRTLIAGSLAAASTLGTKAAAAGTPPPAGARNVVLVHGLYADGSCWSDVIGRLQAGGFTVTSVQWPQTSLDDAAESVRRVLARQDGPTVLVGHSFGGTIISEVGGAPNVSALVFVAARAPDAGEDFAALAKRYPAPPVAAGVVHDGDEVRLTEEAFVRDFASDLPRAQARILFAVQPPFHAPLVTTRTANAAWRTKPSSFAVSTRDHVIAPDLQKFMADRMKARTILIPAGHLSFISHAGTITDLIVQASGRS